MRHEMSLNDSAFNKVKNGTKNVELRLNDEKRQLFSDDDVIEFINMETSERIVVVIEKLFKYSDFEELYKYFDKISMGYDEDDIADPKDMEKYYSKDKQKKYGVLGIKIKLK